jgi:glycosyltransferase involved in cell wall biosynthesis
MKIGFDHTIFLIQKYGGISRYFNEILKNLNRDINIKICCPIHLNDLLDSSDKKVFQLKKINSIPKFSTKMINKFNFYINNIIFNNWKPNIIHKTYFNNYDYKFTKAKIVINVWDLSHEIYHDMYNKPKNWRPKQSSLKKVDHVICSSKKTQADLIKFYNFDYKKTSIVYQSAPNLKTNFQIKDKKDNILLFVGSRLKYKNFEKLLQAFSLKKEILEDFKLVCFGSEKINLKEKFLINKYNLNEKNIQFDFGNDQKLLNYYLNATALIYPSKNEGFGFPPLEAMSYGCPVISSNNSAIIEATGLKKFTFNPEDANEMITIIDKVISSKENLMFLKNYGIKRVRQFNTESMIENLKKTYKIIT